MSVTSHAGAAWRALTEEERADVYREIECGPFGHANDAALAVLRELAEMCNRCVGICTPELQAAIPCACSCHK